MPQPDYYESCLARIELDEDEKPKIDAEVDELTEEDSEADGERFKQKWSTVEALVAVTSAQFWWLGLGRSLRGLLDAEETISVEFQV